MPCFHPNQAYIAGTKKNGKNIIAFGLPKKPTQEALKIPCGQCIGCRLEYSRQWAVRCMHEASLHKEKSYITLTYNNENLPQYGSLVRRDYQLFMKRLRKHYEPKTIRFYQCGEYGEKLGRPHYHACLFGHQFQDLEFFKTINGFPLYTSETLKKLWPQGNHLVGSLTFESAAYVARYILKKQNGKNKNDHYQNIDQDTGEISIKIPEYTTMSRGGRSGKGIANGWYKKYSTDVYPSDQVIVRGRSCRPPRYYDNQYEITNPSDYKLLKEQRKKQALKHLDDQTPDRLAVRETCKLAQIKHLPRHSDGEFSYED